MIRPPPSSTLFPYTTLFRYEAERAAAQRRVRNTRILLIFTVVAAVAVFTVGYLNAEGMAYGTFVALSISLGVVIGLATGTHLTYRHRGRAAGAVGGRTRFEGGVGHVVVGG